MNEIYSIEETEKIAEKLLENIKISNDGATVLALHGDLGAGKTTLVKYIASLLGIEDTIISPTFVIAKFYDTNHRVFKKLVHMDAYRIEDIAELEKIGWDDIVKEKDTLLIVEWPMRIKSCLPKEANIFEIRHGNDTRTINKI